MIIKNTLIHGGQHINWSMQIMNCYLEKLIAKTKNNEFLNNIDILGNIEKIGFKWNNPVSEIDIFSFEKENNIIIPKDYKEFLYYVMVELYMKINMVIVLNRS